MKLLPLLSPSSTAPLSDFGKWLVGQGFSNSVNVEFRRVGSFYETSVTMVGRVAYIYCADQDETEGLDTGTVLGMLHAKDDVTMNL